MLTVIMLTVIMLTVIMLTVIMLSVIMLTVILLSVVLLNVAASFSQALKGRTDEMREKSFFSRKKKKLLFSAIQLLLSLYDLSTTLLNFLRR